MKENNKNIFIVMFFIVLLFGSFVINLIKDDQLISYSERRKLTTLEKATIKNIFNGSYFKNFDNYTTDQFLLREEFRKLKSLVELKIFNKKDYNDIYYKDGYLIQQQTKYNKESLINVTNKINNIINNYNLNNNIYYSVIPDKDYFIKDDLKLDYDLLIQDYKDNIKKGKYIDLLNVLKLKDYYYSDSHWKQENLNKVVKKLNQEMKFTNKVIRNYDIINIGEFSGVYNGQIPYYNINDNLNLLTNEAILNADVEYLDDKKLNSIYIEKETVNDLYDIYLGGAKSIIKIKNNESTNEKNLIIFRDSFSSSLAPLLVNYYKNITLIDTRYIYSNILGEYVDFNNSDILFLYSISLINDSVTLK